MNLPVMPPVTPMLARAADQIPPGDYQYEPKWDGFRVIVFRDGDEILLQSRNHRPLGRYFPELAAGLLRVLPRRIVLDGEIVVAGPRGLDFDALLQRVHPAASRVALLARETPAELVAFDLLAEGDRDLRREPLVRRRARLEATLGAAGAPLHVSPASDSLAVARRWFERFEGAGLDGVLAKPRALPYVEGERVCTKVKHQRSAECVIGGTREAKTKDGPASLLLGLYDASRTLQFVGVATGFARDTRVALAKALRPYRRRASEGHPWLGAGADALGRIPGGPSRWNAGRDMRWDPVRPELVAEVVYDHLQGGRFRHATRLLRLRPDRTPESCTYDQLEAAPPAELRAIFGGARRRARKGA